MNSCDKKNDDRCKRIRSSTPSCSFSSSDDDSVEEIECIRSRRSSSRFDESSDANTVGIKRTRAGIVSVDDSDNSIVFKDTSAVAAFIMKRVNNSILRDDHNSMLPSSLKSVFRVLNVPYIRKNVSSSNGRSEDPLFGRPPAKKICMQRSTLKGT